MNANAADRMGVTRRMVDYWEREGAGRKPPGKMAVRVMEGIAAQERRRAAASTTARKAAKAKATKEGGRS